MRKKLGLLLFAGAAGCGYLAYRIASGDAGAFELEELLASNDATALSASAAGCLLVGWVALFGGNKDKRRRRTA
ncbi:MAG: hypothetical protein AAF957_28540 [Planctomycetota bacterium]